MRRKLQRWWFRTYFPIHQARMTWVYWREWCAEHAQAPTKGVVSI